MLPSIAPFNSTTPTVISDTVNLYQEARGFYLTVDAEVSFVTPSSTDGVDGSTVTAAFKAGYHPWNVIRFRDTGTTATASQIIAAF